METQQISILRPGKGPTQVDAPGGATLQDVAELANVPNANLVMAMDADQNMLGPEDTIPTGTEVLSFVYQLAGA